MTKPTPAHLPPFLPQRPNHQPVRVISRNPPVLVAEHISKSFTTPEGKDIQILNDISLDLYEGQIVALLGRSGSGKSTLLRTLLGLIGPTSGTVTYRGEPVTGPVPGMSMVFQSFALFPWLTVQQNVELGLEAQGIDPQERQKRALAAIDLIGLDGFESAYPKELSGGMRQRVGFARALVMNPDVLFMDEAFSALDVLTSETLRNELLELFNEQKIPTKVLLLVTHNIEEAILMAHRIVVLAPNPGRIRAEIAVNLPYPRDRESPEVGALLERVYQIMTTRPEDLSAQAPEPTADPKSIAYRLPITQLNSLIGLIERIGVSNQREDLPELADEMSLEIDDLFPLLDVAELLGFASVRHGDILLTEVGHTFATADVQGQKRLFAEALTKHIALVKHIYDVLQLRPDHQAPEERFLNELEDFMSHDDAEALLAQVIDWARFAELFEYDVHIGLLRLEAPETQGATTGD